MNTPLPAGISELVATEDRRALVAESKLLRKEQRRSKRLEKALRSLLAVSVPSDDPQGRTAVAMRKAQEALKA